MNTEALETLPVNVHPYLGLPRWWTEKHGGLEVNTDAGHSK